MYGIAGPIETIDQLPIPDSVVRSPEPYDMISVIVAETGALLAGFYDRRRLPRAAVNCWAASNLLRHVLADGFAHYARVCGWVRADLEAALEMLRDLGVADVADIFAEHIEEADHWLGALTGRQGLLSKVDRRFRDRHRLRLEQFFLYDFSFDTQAKAHLLTRGAVREVPREAYDQEMWTLRERAPDRHLMENAMLESGDPVQIFVIDHCRRTNQRLHRALGRSNGPTEGDAPETIRHHYELTRGFVDVVVATDAQGKVRITVEEIDRETRRPTGRALDPAE